MASAIKIENLSKQYRLGLTGTGTLVHDINRWWHMVRGKEDPYLKIGDTNDRSSKSTSDYVWALKDINLEVDQGEVLGIIGKNGAGKSTLLKILSKVTAPTTGSIIYQGRIGSLLEVGTGFHPELTGRENIFLNGAILGMRKKEIENKFNEIVDFSGCERYIDTPVKRYSSGMTVRLGFAVAAFLEPEILVVDEVLAVGDAEFQKKAIGKMQDVSKQEGRTVLFVSHNMIAIKSLCSRVICLANGKTFYNGAVEEGIASYLGQGNYSAASEKRFLAEESSGNENIKLNRIAVKPVKGYDINTDSGIVIQIDFRNFVEGINLDCTIELCNEEDLVLFHQGTIISDEKNSKLADYQIEAILQPFILNSGKYKINIIFGENQKHVLFRKDEVLVFEILESLNMTGSNHRRMPGILKPHLGWKVTFF